MCADDGSALSPSPPPDRVCRAGARPRRSPARGPVPLQRVAWIGWLIGLALIFGAIPATGVAASVLTWSGIGIVAAAYLGGMALVPLLFPRFELKDPSEPDTATVVARRWVAAGSKWVLAAAGGAVLYALADRLL